MRRAALNKRLDQERANVTTSAVVSSQIVTMTTSSKKTCQSAQTFELCTPSQSLVPSYRNSGFSLSHENISIPHGQIVDDVINVQYRRTCFIPSAQAPRVPGSTRALLAIPLSHQPEFEHFDFNPNQCLQYCDQLLQKMFGQDWINKVSTRQN